jgi:hypothetical protein
LRNRGKIRVALRLALLSCTLVAVATTTLAMARSVPSSKSFLLAVGEVVIPVEERECGRVVSRPFAGEGKPGPGIAYINYTASDYMGPGDEWSTGAFRRDALSPPLRDGEKVSFDESTVHPSDIRRDSDCSE